jgi:hypothetical protein
VRRWEHRIIYDWPGTLRTSHRSDTFRAGWGDTLTALERELGGLKAENVVLETAHREEDLTLAGVLSSRAGNPAHPGAILSFDSRFGPLRYWTDIFWQWRANVRAIALGLEALRAVDRYGITQRGEQYTGWARLPPGTTQTNGGARRMTPDAARAVIAEMIGLGKSALAGATADTLPTFYRLAAKVAHPDAAGGSAERWALLNEAAATLGISR